MNVKQYTDEKYTPVSELAVLGQDFIGQLTEYRRQFAEVIQLGNLDFAFLVESPSLIKKRFIKNVELKGMFDFEDPDYILEIAKSIVLDKEVKGIKIPESKRLKELYVKNDKDLTIITNFLSEYKFENQEVKTQDVELNKILPELSRNEIGFITTHNIKELKYSINDFQEKFTSSYETARKSLDKLFGLKLYTKQKVGKKFVYSPTEKLITLTKGGA